MQCSIYFSPLMSLQGASHTHTSRRTRVRHDGARSGAAGRLSDGRLASRSRKRSLSSRLPRGIAHAGFSTFSPAHRFPFFSLCFFAFFFPSRAVYAARVKGVSGSPPFGATPLFTGCSSIHFPATVVVSSLVPTSLVDFSALFLRGT